MIERLIFEDDDAAPLQSAFDLRNERALKVLDVDDDLVGVGLDLVSVQVRVDRGDLDFVFLRQSLRLSDGDFRDVDPIDDEAFLREENGISAFGGRDVECAANGKNVDEFLQNFGRFFSVDVSFLVKNLVPLTSIGFSVVTGDFLERVRALRGSIGIRRTALTAVQRENEEKD